jgi:homotetrameric cytidine deaminase
VSDPRPEPAAGAIDDLVARAREARERAYAPYSRFLVGAAVLTSSGETFTGANVENASYSVAICAERVAASQAVASGHRDINAVAVVSSARTPTPPCGVCRQFLFEFDPDMTVVSEGPDGDRRTWTLSDLLPDAFGPRDLE